MSWRTAAIGLLILSGAGAASPVLAQAPPPAAAPAKPLSPYDKAVQDRIAGRSNEAITALEALSQSAPMDADIWLNLGLAYSAKGDFKAAEAALAKGLKISPNYNDMRVAYARVAEVGLEEHADAYPKALSGGMAQRAAIARALYGRPALLLLDEPFSAVDAFTRMRLQDLLLSIAKRRGATLLLVTHDINEAVYLSDRVIALTGRPGRLAGEVAVGVQAPREREDPSLAAAQAQILRLFQEERVA